MNILRMMAVYDEQDVLGYNLDFYARAGFPTVVLDNGSTDGSYEICQQYLRDGPIVALERLATDRYEWRRLHEALLALALEQRPSHLLLTAPDEFFEVEQGGDLRAAMEEDFDAGYSLIRLRSMEFQITDRDDMSEPNPVARMRHYYHRRTRMDRGYPAMPDLRLTSSGHRPLFPNAVPERPSPRRYVCRHYPLRTPEQARRKIARLMNPPSPGRRSYVRFLAEDCDYRSDPKYLFEYREDHRWRRDDPGVYRRLKETESALMQVQHRYARLCARHSELQGRYGELEESVRESARPGS
jgi:glycosyltransferase involved in cell wall biosynthesis